MATPPEEIDADLFVIGPEAPLVDGLADRLRAAGRLVFGPGADGARLEGSKAFMKEVLAEAGVPTARFGVFADPAAAKAFLRTLPGPWVVKTDGLAAGKGVLVTDSLAEAEADIDAKLSGDAFGDAGRRVVVEEGLTGPECSLLVLCDGAAAGRPGPGPGLQAPWTTATAAPTPGAWGPTRRCPSVDDAMVDAAGGRGGGPAGGRPAGPGHRLPGRALRRADAHRRRPEGARVQRALRRPRDPGGAAPARRRPRRPAGRGGRRRAAAPCPASPGDAAVCVVLASEGYPESPRDRGPDRRPGRGRVAVEGVTVFHAGTAPAPGGSAGRGCRGHRRGPGARGHRPGPIASSEARARAYARGGGHLAGRACRPAPTSPGASGRRPGAGAGRSPAPDPGTQEVAR